MSAARPSLKLSSPWWNTTTYIVNFLRLRWQDDMENSQWLELFHTYTAVKSHEKSKEKSIYSISQLFRKRIAPDL